MPACSWVWSSSLASLPTWSHTKAGECSKCLVRSCIPAPRGEIPYETRLQRLKLSSLENRFTHIAISFVSKCLYGVYDVDPFDYISINTRHTDILKFRHTYARTDCFKNTIFNRFPVYFDRLPLHVRERLLFSLPSFLNNSKHYFTNSSWQVQCWSPGSFLFLCALTVLGDDLHSSCCHWLSCPGFCSCPEYFYGWPLWKWLDVTIWSFPARVLIVFHFVIVSILSLQAVCGSSTSMVGLLFLL